MQYTEWKKRVDENEEWVPMYRVEPDEALCRSSTKRTRKWTRSPRSNRRGESTERSSLERSTNTETEQRLRPQRVSVPHPLPNTTRVVEALIDDKLKLLCMTDGLVSETVAEVVAPRLDLTSTWTLLRC
jgi:hypothetical protein